MKDFKDKVAVVTGAASGIGLGMCQAFAKRGMKLVLADLDTSALQAALDQFTQQGVPAVGMPCDVSQLAEVEQLAELAVDNFGAVHVMCNNAGVGIPTSARHMKLEDWRWIIDVDLWGPIYGVNVFLPLIEAQVKATSVQLHPWRV